MNERTNAGIRCKFCDFCFFNHLIWKKVCSFPNYIRVQFMYLCFSKRRVSCWCCDIWQCIDWLASNIEHLCLASDESNRKQFRHLNICNVNDRKLAKQKQNILLQHISMLRLNRSFGGENIGQFSWNNSCVFWVIWFLKNILRTKQSNCRLSGIAKPRNKVKRRKCVRGVTYVSVVRINCSLIQYWVRIMRVSRISHISDL